MSHSRVPKQEPGRVRPEPRNPERAHPVIDPATTLKDTLASGCALIDSTLNRLLPPETQIPVSIHKAMRHSVFAGGKRLRPILCMEAARLVQRDAHTAGMPPGIEELGSALEMLHTYSLIHDDLPALDNDDLRRGKPTCHVVFGEAIAILAGDALQTYAYEVVSKLPCPAEARVRIVEEIARGTGTIDGMIGGQVMDLEAEDTSTDAATIEYIHRSKTGALITASLVTGGIYAGGDTGQIERLRSFGRAIGLAFQIVDDVLDVTESSTQLGKTAGKDTASEKATYPVVFGLEESLRRADQLIASACGALEVFGGRADTLKALAHFLVERKS
ncbi:MAG TPA: farnesyl diphosphate synthase [Terriglobales bacterium]|nr:farnesyl diphosphate synthase [Terriglobales bacterium]